MEISSEQWKNIIIDGAKVFDIHIKSETADLFAVHASELLKWNRKINLTTVTDPFEIAVKHCLDSIAPVRIIPPETSLLDIGSGGGYPGIPLKILIPSLTVTLIDASRKKTNFLKYILRTLELSDIEAHHIRAEQMVIRPGKSSKSHDFSDDPKRYARIQFKQDFSQAFDIIISRALCSLNDFIFMALPLIAMDGMIIALRGEVSEAEIESTQSYLSGLSIVPPAIRENLSLALTKYKLPFINAQRSMVMISSKRRLNINGRLPKSESG